MKPDSYGFSFCLFSGVVFVLFWPHHVMLKDYSWLSSQESLLEEGRGGRREAIWDARIEPGLAACKASLPTVLSLPPPLIFPFNLGGQEPAGRLTPSASSQVLERGGTNLQKDN